MTAGASDPNIASAPGGEAGESASDNAAWRALRDDADLQFAPVDFPPSAPREPSALQQFLQGLFDALGELLAPLARVLGDSWGWFQWLLLGLLAVFVAVLVWRLIKAANPGARTASRGHEVADVGWTPEAAASLALLEDADRLAAEGRYDEATHLLLQRSIGEIAAARPQWVEPSTTARELARLAALPEAARTAFGVIAERVERSLFACDRLERADWDAARAAYADFALSRLDQRDASLARPA